MTEEEKKELEGFDEAAQEVVGSGGQYTPIDKVLELYPDGVTITGCTTLILKRGPLACFRIKEDDILVPAGSGDLKKLLNRWIEQKEGDFGAVDKFLRKVNYFIKMQKVPQKKYPQPYLKVTSVRRVKADEGD